MTFKPTTRRLFLLLVLWLGSTTPAWAAGKLDTEWVTANFNASASGDIVNTATEAGIFTTLVTAIEAAGLVATLQGDGPFTVFAPTDNAFDKLPQVVVDNLLKAENQQQLIDILGFHVVPGTITTEDLVGKQVTVETVSGAPLVVSGVTKVVHINGNSHILKADIAADNGIIHVIDKVMLPKK